MELVDIIEVNELFGPFYPFVAEQVIEAYGRDSGLALEIGPFAGGVSIELARRLPDLRVMAGDDFPGVIGYLEGKVLGASFSGRIEVRPLNKTDLPLPGDSFDLVVFRGGLFFWDDRLSIVNEAHRVLRKGGLAMVGGGFGADAPDALIDSVQKESRDLNRRLGKQVLAQTELRDLLLQAGLAAHSSIDPRHGLWALIRKV